MKVSYSPEALDDLRYIKADIENRYGKEKSTEIVGKSAKNIRNPETFSNARVNLKKKMGHCKRLSICIYRKELCFYRIEKDYVRIIRVLNVLFHIYFARPQPTRTKPNKMFTL